MQLWLIYLKIIEKVYNCLTQICVWPSLLCFLRIDFWLLVSSYNNFPFRLSIYKIIEIYWIILLNCLKYYLPRFFITISHHNLIVRLIISEINVKLCHYGSNTSKRILIIKGWIIFLSHHDNWKIFLQVIVKLNCVCVRANAIFLLKRKIHFSTIIALYT